MSKMLQWRFEKIDGTWYWTAGELTIPAGPFQSFTACLIDAQENGLFAEGYERRRIPAASLPAIERRSVEKRIRQVLFAPTAIGH
jgi:hypothetical protein